MGVMTGEPRARDVYPPVCRQVGMDDSLSTLGAGGIPLLRPLASRKGDAREMPTSFGLRECRSPALVRRRREKDIDADIVC